MKRGKRRSIAIAGSNLRVMSGDGQKEQESAPCLNSMHRDIHARLEPEDFAQDLKGRYKSESQTPRATARSCVSPSPPQAPDVLEELAIERVSVFSRPGPVLDLCRQAIGVRIPEVKGQ